ncbi:hypothetical protein EVAR_100408_1 [Eumeta japonica]|uniref:Endonuclease/exonuclease/phosphatase domain-containing protein n=1 Tax=Eumeta variegata TaxID=151549 RepID=A0A4C1ZWW8_EUMVA|nr:hypothetical protein EVAR_100408_1 [Eumeta japonica]
MSTLHYIRYGVRGGQPDIHTPCDQGRTGPDAEYTRGPKTLGNGLNLGIMYWNSEGIIGKIRELCDLVQLEDIHVILLGETKLWPQQELKIPNLNLKKLGIFGLANAYRRDEISARGPTYRGTAVLIWRDVHSIFNGPTPTFITGDLNTKYKAWG